MQETFFCCRKCGRAIFRSGQIIKEVNLWDLGEYQAKCYMISEAIEIESLRRYDCSLHQGWYCCRFILMRMVVDKFGTGNNLLVYSDSVIETPEGTSLKPVLHASPQIRLTKRDFDTVTTSPLADRLIVVKFGAIWCPPCRLMDKVFEQIFDEKILPDVSFFEVDIDEERELASRFHNSGVPYLLFFYKGRPVSVVSQTVSVVEGGVQGGMQKKNLEALCRHLLDRARAGETTVRCE